MLFLSRSDVEALLDVKKLVEAMEETFDRYGRGEAVMPPKIYLDLPRHRGDFRAMPAAAGEAACIKWVNSHPDNPDRFGLPTVMAVLVLNDPRNGLPLAFMDATLLTSYRTAAASALASRYLARSDSRSLGIIGCGGQAPPHIMALEAVFSFSDVLLTDLNQERAQQLARDFSHLPCRLAPIEETAGADIVCTLTPGRRRILEKDWIRPGTHINAVGADAPEKSELDPAILSLARIFVDDWDQASQSGEIHLALEEGLLQESQVTGSLAQLVTGELTGRRSPEDLTLFDSTGLAIEDLAAAELVYHRALDQGWGIELDMD